MIPSSDLLPYVETPWVLGKFIVGAVPILFGLPMFVATGASLYSKFLPMRIQGEPGLSLKELAPILERECMMTSFLVMSCALDYK